MKNISTISLFIVLSLGAFSGVLAQHRSGEEDIEAALKAEISNKRVRIVFIETDPAPDSEGQPEGSQSASLFAADDDEADENLPDGELMRIDRIADEGHDNNAEWNLQVHQHSFGLNIRASTDEDLRRRVRPREFDPDIDVRDDIEGQPSTDVPPGNAFRFGARHFAKYFGGGSGSL